MIDFYEITGHDGIKKRLTEIQQKGVVSHAYIFSGKDGIGKTSVARAFANILTEGSAADVIEVSNERYNIKKATALSVDTLRATRTEMFVKPYSADKKVFIIPDADTMSPAAQNALLKVFEEPPGFCVTILIVENYRSLLQTIRSRAVTIRFAPLDDSLIKEYFEKRDEKISEIALMLCKGSIADAQSIISDERTAQMAEEFLTVAKKLDKPSYSVIYDIIRFFEAEKSNFSILTDILISMFEQCLLKNKKDYDTIFLKGIDAGTAMNCVDLIEKSVAAVKNNANYNITVTELLLDIGEIIRRDL